MRTPNIQIESYHSGWITAIWNCWHLQIAIWSGLNAERPRLNVNIWIKFPSATYVFVVGRISFYFVLMMAWHMPVESVTNALRLHTYCRMAWVYNEIWVLFTRTSVLVLETECSWDIRWLLQFMSVHFHDSVRIRCTKCQQFMKQNTAATIRNATYNVHLD